MPIYHFHDANGARHIDTEGTELPDDGAAQVAAVQFAGEMLREAPAKLWERGQWRVEVTDAHNALLFTVITLAVDAPRPEPASSSRPE